jgi:hypothetical protein
MATIRQCPRCGGIGHIPGFSHVMGGMCFKCGGSGKILPPSDSKVQREKELWNDGVNQSVESLESTILEHKAHINIWNSKPDFIGPENRPNRIKTAAIDSLNRKILDARERIEQLVKTIRR